MTWDPEPYLRYRDHRTRPAIDLLARIALGAPARIADLGCGPGNSTALLARRWPDAAVTGVDSSAAMLAKARTSATRANWLQADLADWTPALPFDLLFSNAALQWLPDHAELLPRLFAHLAPGGALAIQMPRNFGAPAHVLLRALAAEGPWAGRLETAPLREPVGSPAWYFDLLAPSAAALDIWETEYLQVLDGDDPVLAWTRGTALRPVQAALTADELAAFEADYRARLCAAYPKRPDGRTLFPFRRLFIVACRSR
jgi:trans-aconitate 2-methyltransferase